MKYFHTIYENADGSYSSLTIEGFGPHTLIGAMQDLAAGEYVAPSGATVVAVELSDEQFPLAMDSLNADLEEDDEDDEEEDEEGN